MIAIDIGEKNRSKRYVEYLVKKHAVSYLALYPKDLHYQNLSNYIKEKYNINADLYSICLYIIARSKITQEENNYSVIISPQDEFLYKLITYGNREIRGLDILHKALTLTK